MASQPLKHLMLRRAGDAVNEDTLGRSDLVCFGELLWDIYEDGEKKMGGAPFNVAAIASMKGIKAAMITAIGTDEEGEEIRIEASKRVNLLCQTNEHKTGTVKVILEKGNPAFVIEKDVAYDYIRFNDEIERICSDARYFCFGTLAQRCNVSRKTLRKILEVTRAVRIYDFNYRDGIDEWRSIFKESIEQTDILKISEAELKLLTSLYSGSDDTLVNTLIRQYGLQYIFVTKGGSGASLYSKKRVLHRAALETDVTDTTGCGDAFIAGIVYALARNFDDERILECALKLAAKIAAVKGAVPENAEYLANP